MRSQTRLAVLLAPACFAVTSALAAEPARRAVPTPPSSRWSESIAAFAAADLRQGIQTGGVLFLGSSSIRLWDDLKAQFNALPVVIKRGFGGAKLSDCVYYLDRQVIPYRPRRVLVYAGENDLAEGGTAEEVLREFTAFVDDVHDVLPQTPIAFISIKPSPARVRLIPEIQRADALVSRYVATAPASKRPTDTSISAIASLAAAPFVLIAGDNTAFVRSDTYVPAQLPQYREAINWVVPEVLRVAPRNEAELRMVQEGSGR